MNLQVLQEMYQNDNRIQKIADSFSIFSMPASKRLSLAGLAGSSIAFIATAIWKQSDCNHLFILNDKEEAAYFHNDLEQLTQAIDLSFFPDSFKKTGSYHELNSSHVMLRTETLSRFTSKEKKTIRKKIAVTYPQALFEKVVHPHLLSGNTIEVKINESLPTDRLMKDLVELGFKREDFVYEPGQFAMRGDIFDIYS